MTRTPPDGTERSTAPSPAETDRDRRERADDERTRLRNAAGHEAQTGRDSARTADDTRQGT